MEQLIRLMCMSAERYASMIREARKSYAWYTWGNNIAICSQIEASAVFRAWWDQEAEQRNEWLVTHHELARLEPRGEVDVQVAVTYLFREIHSPEYVDMHCSTESFARMIGEVIDEIKKEEK